MKDVLAKLDPKTIYHLTKVKTDNPDSRVMKDGDTVNGQAVGVPCGVDYNDFKLVVGDLVTSPLVDVQEKDGVFTIQTKNSGYTLIPLDDK